MPRWCAAGASAGPVPPRQQHRRPRASPPAPGGPSARRHRRPPASRREARPRRTARTPGPRRLAAAALAFTLFAAAGVRAGWRSGAGDAWRWALPVARGLGLGGGADPLAAPGPAARACRARAGHVPRARGLGPDRPRHGPRLGHLSRIRWCDPWLRRRPLRILRHSHPALETACTSAVELRADHDLTDVPAIVRGC